MSIADTTLVIMGSRDDLANPKESSGRCWLETDKLHALLLENEVPHKIAYAENLDDPYERYNNLGQYGNHYAIYVPEEELIVDYTLRQFDPDCPHPFVGSKESWFKYLSDAWETENIYEQFEDNIDDIEEQIV